MSSILKRQIELCKSEASLVSQHHTSQETVSNKTKQKQTKQQKSRTVVMAVKVRVYVCVCV